MSTDYTASAWAPDDYDAQARAAEAAEDYTPEELLAMEATTGDAPDDARPTGTDHAVELDQIRSPHLDQMPTLTADVTVYGLVDGETGECYWHVSVKHATRKNPDGEIVHANYRAYSPDTDDGLGPYAAAAELLETVLS
jgi:hypothetical protein